MFGLLGHQRGELHDMRLDKGSLWVCPLLRELQNLRALEYRAAFSPSERYEVQEYICINI